MSERKPLLRIVRGDPSDEELAAIIAAVLTRAGAAADTPVTRSLWRDHSAALHAPVMAGPGAWRASALPR